MLNKKFIIENTKTLLYALLIAIIIRSTIIQPFYIPSSSMEPNLLVGDRLFVTKYSYGYSKHSFPFSPPFFKNRIMNNNIGKPYYSKTSKINSIIYDKFKTKKYDLFLSISDEKDYSVAFTIIQTTNV